MEKPRMCVSLLYLDKDNTTLMDRRGPQSISLSTKYGQSRARQYSGPSSVFAGNCRVFESIRVYARCLRSDIEYRTMRINSFTTAHQLIQELLTKFKLKHVDPKLFYLTMDVTVRKTGIPIKRTMVLEDDARPAQLRSCNPWGECKFSLQMRKGGLVRVYDSVLVEELKYKCLLISEETTVEDVIR